MRFDVANDNIHSAGTFALGGFEHGVGLAHAGGVAEEDLQLAAARFGFCGLHARQQCVGVRSLGGHGFTWSS